MKKNVFIDLLKGIAIISVVVGHCIQYGNGLTYMNNLSFFSNDLFRFIYSFHMPFFMLISGYLFFFSTQSHTSSEIVKSKISRCVIPIFIWTILYAIITSVINKTDFKIFSVINSSFTNISFLWALFFCSISVLLINKVYNDSYVVYSLLIFLSLIITNSSMNFTNYLLPFFIIGFIFSKYQENVKKYLSRNKSIILFVLLLVIYIIMFHFFDYDKYIYTSVYSITNNINNLYINPFRFFIGLVGSILIILLVKF